MQEIIKIENLSKVYSLGETLKNNSFRDCFDIWLKKLVYKTKKLINVKTIKNKLIGKYEENNNENILWALKDVSFSVNKGEVLGIIGNNGAGKSTLLKILSRITSPTKGMITLKGRVASLLEVGTGFNAELTGRENIFLNGAILGMSTREIKENFNDIVAFADVEKFLDTPVKRYSSGMYVRLAFAVAAHLSPEILLVDEVLAVGDVEFQKKCLGKMNDVAKGGRTVIFVSHNMAIIENICDKVIILNKGRCSNIGKPKEMINEYYSSLKKDGVELLNKNDCNGSGVIKFLDYNIEDLNGKSKDSVHIGEDFIFRLDILSLRKIDINKTVIGIGIYTLSGQKCMSYSSHFKKNEGYIPKGKSSLMFTIYHLMLVPGRYRIDLCASVNFENSSHICNAGFLDVNKQDFYGSGQLPTQECNELFVGEFDVEFSCKL